MTLALPRSYAMSPKLSRAWVEDCRSWLPPGPTAPLSGQAGERALPSESPPNARFRFAFSLRPSYSWRHAMTVLVGFLIVNHPGTPRRRPTSCRLGLAAGRT